MIRIAIASDHAGYRLKVLIRAHLERQGHATADFGSHDEDPVDYPDFIRPAAESVSSGRCDLGIVLGGSGNGEAMVANKIVGVRCAVCWNEESARLAKAHNNANMIAIGARLVGVQEALEIVDRWLQATFSGGRHRRRIAKIEPNYPSSNQ
jgi:ribose 5-phosphate isomerase B